MNKAININICFFTFNKNEETALVILQSFIDLLITKTQYKKESYTKTNKIKGDPDMYYDSETFTCSNNNNKINFYVFNRMESNYNDSVKDEQIEHDVDIKLKAISKVFEIHLILILGGDLSMKRYITILFSRYASCSFLLIPKESNDFVFPNKFNKYFLFNDSLNNDFNQALYNKLEDLDKEYPKYCLFQDYSQEKYYNTFTSYYLRKEYLKSLSKAAQIDLFNSFEKFSFDANDNADDCLILLELFTMNQEKISARLNKSKCDSCKLTQIICEYNVEKKDYYCENCLGFLYPYIKKEKETSCCQCKGKYESTQKDEILQLSCCRQFICILCLKFKIKENEEVANSYNNLKFITCFCGVPFKKEFIKEIIHDKHYDEDFKFEIYDDEEEEEDDNDFFN